MSEGARGHRLNALFSLVLKVMVTATLLGMAVITFVDVVGRYLFSAPIPGAFEIQEFGMAILIFSGLPLITKSRGHITVSLFNPLFERNATVWRIKQGLVHLVSAGILAFVAYCLFRQGANFYAWGNRSAFLQMPQYPVAMFMALMAIITCLILLYFAVTAFFGDSGDTEADEGTIL